MLSVVLGGAVALGCFATTGTRLGISEATLSALSFATAAVFVAIGIATFVARRPDGSPGQGLLLITLLIAVTGWVSLALNGYSILTYLNPAVSLGILPALVVITQRSGATREQIQALVFRCAAGVVYVSLALAVVAPSIAFGTTNQDARRLSLGPLTHRLSGVAGHPNFLAFVALVVLVISLTTEVRRRAIHIASALATLALTEARNAFLSLAILLLVLFIMNGRRRLLRATLVAPVAAVVLILGQEWLQDDTSTLTSDVATNGRFRVWDLVFTYFPERPIYGWGPVAFRESSDSPLLQANLAHAHNQLLEALAEGGLVGLALMLALTICLAKIAFRHRSHPLYTGTLVILLASYTTQIFLSPHMWGANIGMVPALLVLPIFLSAGRDHTSPDQSGRPSDGAHILAGSPTG
ncbi:hypothetical protein GCM10009803_12470 [Microbacterium ginsengiterrae]